MSEPDYAALRGILDRAFVQSAHGKGKERHAGAKPFLRQPILEIGRMVGPGFNTGQVMKKTQEAMGMLRRGESDRAVAELLGAIVYAASAVILIEEQKAAGEAIEKAFVDALLGDPLPGEIKLADCVTFPDPLEAVTTVRGLKVGDAVVSNKNPGAPGTVHRVHGDGTFVVRWRDGSESYLGASDLMLARDVKP